MQPVLLAPWLSLFVLLGLPLGVPPLPETQLISKIAPEECLFYVSSSGMAVPDSKSTNQTEQLLAEPEVQKTFGEIEKMIRGGLSKSMDKNSLPPGVTSDEVVDLVKMLLTRPMAVYISDIQMGSPGPNIRGGLALKIGDDADKVKAMLGEITKTMPPQLIETRDINGDKFQSLKFADYGGIVWGFKKNFFVAAVGEGEMEALLKRAGGNAPKWLSEIRRDLPVERVSTVGFVNVKAFLKIIVPMAGPQAAVTLEALGVSNVSNIASVAGLDQSNYLHKIHISIDGEPQGLMQFASIGPLSAEDMASIPADATMALAVKINPFSLYNNYVAMVEKVAPSAAGFIRSNIEQTEAQLGLKIGQDILTPFGDVATFYAKFNAGNAGIAPEQIFVIQVKDFQQAAKIQEQLIQKFQAAFEEVAKHVQSAPKLIKDKVAGKESYSLQIPRPGFPAIYWCLTEKELIVSLMGFQGVQTYLSRPAGFKSLGQSPEVAKLFTSEGGPTAVFYWNTQQTCNEIYPMLPVVAAMLQPRGINLNLSLLPPQTAIGPHLTPMVSSVRRTKSGIEITERSPLPGLGITQSEPIAITLLWSARMESAGSSLEPAQRAASINNMKMIMLAMHNYHDANKRFPPAYKADKEGKPLLSWRVMILPYIEQGDLYDQFHRDEPWDSEHNKKLIAKMPAEYKSPNSKAGEGKTNYLTVRGENTVFPGQKGVRIADITDGTAFTIAIVEAADEKAVIWTKPDDFEIDNQNPMKGLAGLHPGVILAAFADGSVHTLSATIDPEVLRGLFSRNGGEAVQGKF
ncbi:MAG: DUF1559 domain-containing protein [Thermoguttaceae bacterium]